MRPSMLAAAIAACLAAPRPAGAQTLASRVAAAGDGAVVFQFAPRDGVCGDGEGAVYIGRRSILHASGSGDRSCRPGPVQVRATLRAGAVERLESWVGPVRAREGRALDEVPAADAARWLLDVAREARPRVAEQAMSAAMFADAAPDWRALLAIARDDARPREVRHDAGFWLSQLATAAALGHPGDLAALDDGAASDADEMKMQAVFVLSQRPRGEGVPALLEVAQRNADARVRGRALFWLGQSGDARALALFEHVLSEASR